MKEEINRMVEEHPEVVRLKKEIEQRTNRLHKEILALGLSLENIQHFLKIYEEFHYMVCNNNPRNYSHARFVNDILAGGDLPERYKKKSDEWINWQLAEVKRTLRRMSRYTEVAAQNQELKEEIKRLKEENKLLEEQIEWQAQMYGMQMDRSTFLNLKEGIEVDFNLLREEQQIEILCLSIDDLNFSTRTRNLLKCCDLDTVGELIKIPEHFLMNRLHGFGRKSLKEVQDALRRFNLKLGMNIN